MSKKFLGDKTPREIQDRILDILFTWTDKYPELGKIKEAYTMLRTQGVAHEPQKNVIKPSNKKSTTDTTLKLMESDKFKRLLQSKNQKDIEAANLMIQNMVRDNDRKSQIQNRRFCDLQSANENSILLKEMLDEIEPALASDDTLSTLGEIFNNCIKLRPTVIHLAEESHDSESFTSKVIETSDLMGKVIEMYTSMIINRGPIARKPVASLQVSNLLDVASPETNKVSSSSNGTLSELNDIFSSRTPDATKPAQIDSALLTPQVLPPPANSTVDIMALINRHKQTSPDDLLGCFDIPSTQSPLKTSSQKTLVETVVPLSDIDFIVTGMKSRLLNSTEETEIIQPSVDSDDDVHNLICDDPPAELEKVDLTSQVDQKIALKDINLDINEIEPSDTEPPRTIVDEKKGLKIVVNFTKDKPSKDVSVLVISVINQGPFAINNFQFDAVVAKPSKLRALKASSQALPGVKPFKPPTETINQVLLLMNPTGQSVNMMAILTYNSEDDEDPCKESIEVKDIPYST